MNLIEQLGGYENSKCYLESCGDMDTMGGFTPTQIRSALLDYRRAHNIFESGDSVVWLFRDDNTIYKVVDFDDEIGFEIEVRTSNKITSYYLKPEWIHEEVRHAKLEELAAGRRL